jgi:peptide/nickel transport system substrate-binding protein
MTRRWLPAAVAVPAALLATGLTAGTPASAARVHETHHASGPSGTLTISNESGSLWTCDFNPYNPAVFQESAGFVYEPLVFVDSLDNAKTTPWLASSYAWSDANKVLTFTMRKGVKWTNGTPLTAADVAFSFNLLKKFPALDINAVWSVLDSVVQKGSDQVVLTFKTAAVPYFYYVADQVSIVPESIWSKIKNPVTYPDTSPVGSGPYTVKNCTGQNITYAANTHYWQPGLPKIATLEYPAFTSNQPANTYLATGQAQWGGQFIPGIKAFYLSKSSSNHDWFPPVANVSLFINQKVAPLNDLAVRQAMAYAINRSQVASIGEYGYEPAANQTGIVTPTFSSWLDKAAAAQYGYGYDPKRSIAILEKDGYKRGPGGIFQKGGKSLSFTIINVGGNSDWVADLQIVQHELAAVGIKVTVDNLAGTDFDNDLYRGSFQLAFDNETGGPSPYYELRQLLYGPNTAPIGQLASTNYERYSNPATDSLINAYAATTSVATQHQIVDKLEGVMLADVPVIPITESVDWFQYSTSQFTGWPTPTNPFAQPAPYNTPDNEVLLLHLSPKK